MTSVAIVAILLCLQTSWCRIPEESDIMENDPVLIDENSECDYYGKCFHQPAPACPTDESPCKCLQLPGCKKAILCCNVDNFSVKDEMECGNFTSQQNKIVAFYIRNGTFDVFDFNLTEWKKLESLSVTDGAIRKVKISIPKKSVLSCLNLSSNGIQKFQGRTFHLYNLNFLDLTHNNLTKVPWFKTNKMITVDILDNPMSCLSVSELLNKSSKVMFNNEHSTYCLTEKNFYWFNSYDVVNISEIRRIHDLQNNCLSHCTCRPFNLRLGTKIGRVFTVTVDCSNGNLTSLPVPLPPHTVTLNVSNNKITNLKELAHPSYQEVKLLQADNNQIQSIQQLEGTLFRNVFEILSLRNNSIKYIDTYVLEFPRRSISVREVYLGLNYLSCDCTTMTEFKMWLETKKEFIIDFKDIRCEGFEYSILYMDSSTFCQSRTEWNEVIFFIIAVEIFLLVGLAVKLSYDYWVFKTTGNLPWPASRMPKLPFDWLCE